MKYFSSAVKGIAIASIAMVIYSTYYKFWFNTYEVLLIFSFSSLQAIFSRITRVNLKLSDLNYLLINAITSYAFAFTASILMREIFTIIDYLKFSWVWLLTFSVAFLYSYFSNRKKVDEINKKIERISKL
ncbi:DUF3021 family protein [Lactococcus lactis subsp. lactis]|uniref:hypothetical protein n=1 Tax=Lactococcus lactis TaxID=1358 RepID=UPI00223B999D|nr:hypothetical protein [Lactococcus lactis]MCT0017565.1 DUF3021 family protein [Lactococcus lactis subsp. lactis]